MPTRPQERWNSRTVYKLLLWLFRPRPGLESLTPPFLSHRPLTEAEFNAAQAEYVSHQPRFRVRNRSSAPSRINAAISAALDRTAAAGDWEAHKLIGGAAFASRPVQQRARAKLKDESTKGPRARRSLLAEARRALPQAKNLLSPVETTERAALRRSREFLWAFLMGEARALAAKQDRRSVADVLAQAGTIAQHYPYLGLSVAQIRVGLSNRYKQPALDAVAKYRS